MWGIPMEGPISTNEDDTVDRLRVLVQELSSMLAVQIETNYAETEMANLYGELLLLDRVKQEGLLHPDAAEVALKIRLCVLEKVDRR